MSEVVSCSKTSLPRELDVSVSISRPLTELATDMTMICFATPDVDFLPDNNRVQFFSSLSGVEDAVGTTSSAYAAARAFFARTDRPTTMAIGRIFEEPTAARLESGALTNINYLMGVTDGSLQIDVNGQNYQIKDIDFSSCTSAQEILVVVNTVIQTSGAPVTVGVDTTTHHITITTTTTGDGAELSYMYTLEGVGTDISGFCMCTEDTATSLIQGYTPSGITSELALIKKASACLGNPIYGWVLDSKYRDSDDAKLVMDWAEANTPCILSLCTNSANAYNTSNTDCVVAYGYDKQFKNTCIIYHHSGSDYPDMSYLALALSVNYALENSTLTMKFKQLDGIATSPLTESQVTALDSRNCNCYVLVGNSSSVVREGKQCADTWFTDSRVNLDNYKEELQVEVYNVFLRNKKIPYTTAGQSLLISACSKINARYTSNGTFADREVEDTTTENGVKVLPATIITPATVAGATASERASRIAPPIAITAYEAGAMHSVAVDVSVYN